MSDEVQTTLLVISEIGVPVYSARGLTQTLEPISAATSMRRTVNGEMHDLSAPQFRKYSSQISCDDQDAPAFDGLYPGQEVVVDCIAHLAYRTAGGSPSRPVVDGSEKTDGEFTFYRPRLTMIVTGFSEQENEYGAQISWTLTLEEK